MKTEAEIQLVSSDIHTAILTVIRELHPDLDEREGWTAIVMTALYLLNGYLDAVSPADREAAAQTLIEALDRHRNLRLT